MATDRPLLVIVSGPPAAGKTTLAARLARELRLPLISRDQIKEAMMDSLEVPDRAASRRVGAASYAVLYAMARSLLEAGVSLVLESNFRRTDSAPELRSLVALGRAVLVHCSAPPDVLRRRYAERSPFRHPGHHDARVELDADLDASAFDAPDLGIPIHLVDTGDGYRPGLADLLAILHD